MLGYYGVFVFRELILKAEINKALDYNIIPEDRLYLVKITNPLYHQIDRPEIRTEGEIEFEGKFYSMVKQKLTNDTLYVYFINNVEKEKLYYQLAEHNDGNITEKATSNKRTENLLKTFIKEYISTKAFLPALSAVFSDRPQLEFTFASSVFKNTFLPVTSPPPEADSKNISLG